MGARVGELLRAAAARLEAAGVEDAAREARWLLEYALGMPEGGFLDRGAEVEPGAFEGLVARRVGREPLALILGTQEFCGMTLAVSRATLIPRLDSETVVEAAMELAPVGVRRVLDLGTGTGALLLGVLARFSDAFGVGVDLTEAACVLARGNAGRNGMGERAGFFVGDWAGAVAGRFEVVVSNPPYIARGEIASLMPEVARFEPARALDGGEDGLEAYRLLVPALEALLTEDGVAVLEVGHRQAGDVLALGGDVGLHGATRADGAGIARAVCLRKKAFGSAGGPD